MIEQVVRRLRLLEERSYHPTLIQVGEQQARELADDLNVISWRGPITWEDIMTCRKGTLFGVPLQGVESPDYLNVVGEPA